MLSMIGEMWQSLGGGENAATNIEVVGDGHLASAFKVTDLAAASIGVAVAAIAELIAVRHGRLPAIRIDRRLSSLWFAHSMRPLGWTMPPQWDAIAGDYRAADGWIRLHTNAPHHRNVALDVLGVAADKDEVAKAVAHWTASDLEAAIVARGGCAAEMRSVAEWRIHDQGRAVAQEPLIWRRTADARQAPAWIVTRDRPLMGIRILDLTRVLAGPVATRFLAGYGAEVLRIDPPSWDEPAVVPEVTLGKRCARLDLRDRGDRSLFERLLVDADVVVHGYRPGALDGLGFDAAYRRRINPTLVDVSLDAYGWTGPWRNRRGFDSLVQMSTGIAESGMQHFGSDKPAPLPVQALDHATGYLAAAAAVRGLTERLTTGAGIVARTSLARVAALLAEQTAESNDADIASRAPGDDVDLVEKTEWGDVKRLVPPASILGTPMQWDRPAERLGASPARWSKA